MKRKARGSEVIVFPLTAKGNGTIAREIPTAGTFHQRRPLDLLFGSTECYSFDLKSATDRWPLLLMFEAFQCLFDRSFASAVVNSTLACNIFDVSFVKRKRGFLSGRYAPIRCKQPRGLPGLKDLRIGKKEASEHREGPRLGMGS